MSIDKNQNEAPVVDESGAEEFSQVLQDRLNKGLDLAKSGVDLYPNTFRPKHKAALLVERFAEFDEEALTAIEETFVLAGRMMARRDYGKSVFFDIMDSSGKIQAYIRKQSVTEDVYNLFKQLDIGDIVGFSGKIFKTKTGELSILVNDLELVTKGLWPLPEKFHEMNVEMRYRQRYVDLIMNESSRRVFHLRSRLVASVREFMTQNEFVEVETPMMHIIPGGAAARPFETFHNALDRQLFLRIAPELYLKRLLVGGFDRVFEINRCFRNEGLSVQHNPEFTMMEFYQSYADFVDMMNFVEDLVSSVVLKTVGAEKLTYQGAEVSFARPWRRLRFGEAIVELGGAPSEVLTSREAAMEYLKSLGGGKPEQDPHGKVLAKIFDIVVEPKLVNPTFITHYPVDISPLSRRNGSETEIADRFELFCVGRELANAFSELNDPLDQKGRFQAQVDERAAGDEEGMHMDDDYIRALMYGMPPAGGVGLGIDRLVMLLADVSSIKDVILFPHMRPQARG